MCWEPTEPSELHLARDTQPARHWRCDEALGGVAHCAREEVLGSGFELHVVPTLGVQRAPFA